MRISSRLCVAFLLFMGVISFRHATAAGLPDISSIKGTLTFCGEPVPLDNRDIRERLDKELLVLGGDLPQITLWIKRSGRHFQVIEKILQENNMPEDLKYLVVVESSLRSSAGSSKGAVGFWQFIKETGIRYGLTINENIDERRNLQLSTKAAVRYLNDLHQQFGSWSLAAAAYNMGEERLQAALNDQGVDNYYQVDIFDETEAYIPKILAVKSIFSDPARFGISLDRSDYYPPIEVDHVILSNADNVPIRLIAEAAGSYYKEIRDLNPEIRQSYLGRGNRMIAIPKGSAENFHARFSSLSARIPAQNKKLVYTVQSGDTLTAVAAQFKVSLSKLLAWNDIKEARHLYPGERLIIHK